MTKREVFDKTRKHLMLTYSLDPKARTSLYEQLYQAVKHDIETGDLDAGTKLPSKRALAQHLGVSVITVESAYRQLAAEGYIDQQERRGNFVNSVGAFKRPAQKRAASKRNVTKNGVAGSSLPDELPLLADFSGTHQSGRLFPYHLWAKTVRKTLAEASKGALLRSSYDPRGAAELRAAIAAHLAGFRGMMVDPECLVIGAGAQDLYGVLVQLLGRDRVFGVEDPGYPALRAQYELNGARTVPVSLDDQGMSVIALRNSGASVAHCTPAHQFPSAVIMSAGRRRELLDWAHEEHHVEARYVIEDDYDSEFRMGGRPIPPLMASDDRESVIYMNTFTRSLGSVFRIAYMVLPPHLMERYAGMLGARACKVGALEQLELARFIESGDYERHIRRQRTAYRKLQDVLAAGMAHAKLKSAVAFRELGSGLHFLMDCDLEKLNRLAQDGGTPHRHISAEAIEKAALEHGVRLMRMDNFFATDTSPMTTCGLITYVMNLSGLDIERAEEICAALTRTFESLIA